MKSRIPLQLAVTLAVLGIGAIFIATEYGLMHVAPRFREAAARRIYVLLPYRNDALGIEMEVAEGIYGQVKDFPGGVKISRPGLLGGGPSLIITSQINPGPASKFSPELLAKWEAAGTTQHIQGYRFEHTYINGRDTAVIWRQDGPSTVVTAHLIAPDRIVEVGCSSGPSNAEVLTQACESSIATIQILGPPSPPPESVPTILNLKNLKLEGLKPPRRK